MVGERRSVASTGPTLPDVADLHFDGRVAVVTGAGGGLGREHARLLAARGARVVVNDVDIERARATAAEITDESGVAVADGESVATPDSGGRIVRGALEAFGRVDIVVNNAGNLHDKAFHNLTPEAVDAVLDVHLRGAFWVTRAAWPHLRDQGYGRVVNTTSNAGLLGNFGQASYGAAKMGIVGLTRALACEGSRYGIRVNAVAPLARTAMTEALLGSFGDRLDPALVSPVVAWLSHEDCGVTGEIYSAAGGRVARYFIGLTRGFHDPALTPEGVRDNLDAIRSEAGYTVPGSPAEELAQILALSEPV